MKKFLVGGVVIFLSLCSVQTAFAAVSYSQSVTLAPGWNIVSTPRILESHSFSAPETLENFSIYILDASRPSGWATMSELGQTEFTPLYGYFINNKGTSTQTLTFNYKADTTPNERLFERSFTTTGWYSFGIANPSYAKEQGSSTIDTDNPDHILNSLLGATSNYDSVVDFTDASYATDTDSVALADPWNLKIRSADVSNETEINLLNDFRETKGYAIYIKNAATLNGFQNDDVPQCSDGVDNDGDGKTDFPSDFGCPSTGDNDEANTPAGTLLLIKSPLYTDQATTTPQTAYKIGEYQLISENDSFAFGAVGLELVGSTSTIASLTDIYLTIDAASSSVLSVGTSTFYWVAENEILVLNSSTTLGVYASLPSSMASGETIGTQLIFAGISFNSGDIIATEIADGQTFTATTTSTTSSPTPAPAPAPVPPPLYSITESNCSLYFLENGVQTLVTTDDYGICPGQAVIVKSDESYGVVWSENRSGTETTQIYFKKLNAEGQSLTGDIKLTQAISGRGLASIAWSGTEYGIAWQDLRDDVWYPCPDCTSYGNNPEIYFVRVSSDGNKIDDEARLTNCPDQCQTPQLLWNGDGYDLSWRENVGGIYVSRDAKLDLLGNII